MNKLVSHIIVKICQQLILFYSLFKEDPSYKQEAAVVLGSETHGGEDVPIYSSGPMSFLFTGTVEQSYVAHAMAYSACIGAYDTDDCRINRGPYEVDDTIATFSIPTTVASTTSSVSTTTTAASKTSTTSATITSSAIVTTESLPSTAFSTSLESMIEESTAIFTHSNTSYSTSTTTTTTATNTPATLSLIITTTTRRPGFGNWSADTIADNWRLKAKNNIDAILRKRRNTNIAKNILFYLGDGMGKKIFHTFI